MRDAVAVADIAGVMSDIAGVQHADCCMVLLMITLLRQGVIVNVAAAVGISTSRNTVYNLLTTL